MQRGRGLFLRLATEGARAIRPNPPVFLTPTTRALFAQLCATPHVISTTIFVCGPLTSPFCFDFGHFVMGKAWQRPHCFASSQVGGDLALP
jgi:hypothetical protein